VALRLICERERAVLAFVPEEFWNLSVVLNAPAGDSFTAKLFKINKDKFKIADQAAAEAVLKAIQTGAPFEVTAVEAVPKLRYAPPPFTTSTLQQAANTSLKFSASGTMKVAQQLYEGVELGAGGPTGLITYMRTDSVNIAAEAQKSCRDYIGEAFGKDYLPGKANFYKSKAGAQEAHEAIRPTDVRRTPEVMAQYLDSQQLRLYALIWKRFIASQMAPMEQRQTTVDTDIAGNDKKTYTFRASALVTTFAGFSKVYESTKKKSLDEVEIAVEADEPDADAKVLGKLKKSDRCKLEKALKEQKFTEPPPRFTEATLIKELEANGIGRPSTYATILQTIQTRQYVDRDKGKLIPSVLGFKINDFLVAALPDLIEVNFTSKMESNLDEIEDGKLTWTQMLNEFYTKFALWLDTAKHDGAQTGDKVDKLVSLLSAIKWAPAEKREKRSYDDGKFFKSVTEKLQKDGKISAKQWDALLSLAVKYAAQLPQLEKVAEKSGFGQELTARQEHNQAREQYRADNTATPDEQQKSTAMFDAFANVQWAPPQKSGPRTYDDKKFFDSLKKQAESGKVLSDKQLLVMARFAAKYSEFIQDFDQLAASLNIPAATAPPAVPLAEQQEVTSLLNAMAAVTQWAEPVKKGGRTYDDKSFVDSIKKQFESGKQLSSKQLFALKKMAGKYVNKE
jgi:DNA topoisomerase-1